MDQFLKHLAIHSHFTGTFEPTISGLWNEEWSADNKQSGFYAENCSRIAVMANIRDLFNYKRFE